MYFKHLTLILLSLNIASLTLAQCPTNINFNSQADIDNFSINYPGCTMIPGNVSIGGAGDDLTNLNGLSGITSIGEDLYFASESLPNLIGLSGLTSIGGDFYITTLSNSLASLDGIENLTSIGGFLLMEFNDGLTNVNGLSGLTTVGGLYL